MKKIIILFAVILFGTAAFAQQLHITQFATLTHNDTVTGVWYGTEALSSAYSAAVHGDIVTLSPGTFNAPYPAINKAITIRGAGMQYDSIANIASTNIQKNVAIDVPNISGNHLKIEGVRFIGEIVCYYRAYSPHFNKCRFNSIRRGASYSTVDFQLPTFTNCIIGGWDGSNAVSNAMFINSVVSSSWTSSQRGAYLTSDGWGWSTEGSTYNCGVSSDVYYNCIIGIPPALTDNKRNIINCITYSTNTGQGTAANVYNTVGITDSTDFYANRADHNNSNVHGFESIFKTFRGTYTAGETFVLTPQAAATYLGSDSTQVGIYGGSTPYNPKATDMRIQKYAVGFYSDQNGQLQINVTLDTVSH